MQKFHIFNKNICVFGCQVVEYLTVNLSTLFSIAKYANSVDLDEVAHIEPPHLDLHCLPSSQ